MQRGFFRFMRACVGHVFGQLEHGMGGMFLRSVGLARAKVGVAFRSAL